MMKSTWSITPVLVYLALSLQNTSAFVPLCRQHHRTCRQHGIMTLRLLKEPETLLIDKDSTPDEFAPIQDSTPLGIEIQTKTSATPSIAVTTTTTPTTIPDVPPSRESTVSTSPFRAISTILFGDKSNNNAEYRRGLITIGFITLLFSSSSPALSAAFTSTETSPPVLLLNAAVSAIALVGLVCGGPLLEATTPLPSSLLRNQMQEQRDDDVNDKQTTSLPFSLELSQETRAGLEMGLWKFLGTTANLYGLSLTTASHGAFLIQLTTLIVPVVQGIMGVPIPRQVQLSVGLALAGVFMFTQDVSGGISTMPNVALGDALCVVAAGFYATYDLRLFQFGKRVKPLSLITNKIATQALFSTLLLLVAGREETLQFFSSGADLLSSSNVLLALVVLWCGVAVNAVAPFLQVGGQQAIGPTRAQTLYASQPLWAAILSCVFLGETVGAQGMIGGSAFLAALALAATAEAPDPDCGKENCEV